MTIFYAFCITPKSVDIIQEGLIAVTPTIFSAFSKTPVLCPTGFRWFNGVCLKHKAFTLKLFLIDKVHIPVSGNGQRVSSIQRYLFFFNLLIVKNRQFSLLQLLQWTIFKNKIFICKIYCSSKFKISSRKERKN